MATTETPKAIRQYVLVMRALGAVFGLCALIFFFFPQFIFFLVNIVPRVFDSPGTLEDSSERFWLVLATSMMVMLTVCCFGAAANPGNRILAWIVMAAKLCSSVGYLYSFIVDERLFGYLVGFVTDFPIFLGVGWFALRAFRALSRESGQAEAGDSVAP